MGGTLWGKWAKVVKHTGYAIGSRDVNKRTNSKDTSEIELVGHGAM